MAETAEQPPMGARTSESQEKVVQEGQRKGCNTDYPISNTEGNDGALGGTKRKLEEEDDSSSKIPTIPRRSCEVQIVLELQKIRPCFKRSS